jgi:hypothetical protein
MTDFKLMNMAEFMAQPIVVRTRPEFRVDYDQGQVKVRGEALHQVRWQGRQWAVTDYGIEARDGTYAIEKARLGEMHGTSWSWPQHMAEKGWPDVDDFVTAWLVALAVHGVKVSRKAIAEAVERAAPKGE